MTTELIYLAMIAAFTAVIWIPYGLNSIMVKGLMDAVGYQETPKELSPWAKRMKAAHYNAVENLVVFGVLVLVAHAAGVGNDATTIACVGYFWARVAHLAAYTFRIPWARTVTFVVGFGCQLTLAWQILV